MKPQDISKKKPSRLVVTGLIVMLIVVALLAVDFITFPGAIRTSAPTVNKGKNGLWLRYLWYFGKHSQEDADAMIRRLHEDQIAYAYFHVRSTNSDGILKFRYPENAIRLNGLIHERLPGVKSIAWVYVPSKYGQEGVDLSNATTRANLIKEALWLTRECGFDGIQWDYELFPCGEPNFSNFLDQTRKVLGQDCLISVATPMWYPGVLWGWTDGYFTEIAGHCDQIAVMCYDSFFYLPRAYTWLVSQQAIHVTIAVAKAGGDCKVIFGVPVYDGGTLGHITHSENIFTSITDLPP